MAALINITTVAKQVGLQISKNKSNTIKCKTLQKGKFRKPLKMQKN